MTPQDRLAAALRETGDGGQALAFRALRADPTIAADMERGDSIRRLGYDSATMDAVALACEWYGVKPEVWGYIKAKARAALTEGEK